MLYPLSYGSGVSKHASSGCIVAQGWAMVGTTSGSTPAGGQTDRVQSNPSPTDRSRPVPPQLLPRTAEADGDGTLLIGGCNVLDLAEEFGTPLFVYDEAHLRARCAEAVAAFGVGRAFYATKAFLCTAMARLAYEEGMHLDVASGGELYVALRAGVPARITLIQAFLWLLGAAVVTPAFGMVDPEAVPSVGFTVVFAGMVVCGAAFLLSDFGLRPIAAVALAGGPAPRARFLGALTRVRVAWAVGSGVPIVGLLIVAVYTLAGRALTLERLSLIHI